MLEIAQCHRGNVGLALVVANTVHQHVVGPQHQTDVRLFFGGTRLEFDDVEIELVMRGSQHIEESVKHGDTLRVLVILEIALRLKIQNQRKHLRNRVFDV